MPNKMINLTMDFDLLRRFEAETNKSALIVSLLKNHYQLNDLSMEQLQELKALETKAQEIYKDATIRLG